MATERVLILAATTAYQTDDLLAAAQRLGVEAVLAQDRCMPLAETWPGGSMAIDFRDPHRAAQAVVEESHRRPIHGVIATDELTSVIAARIAELLDLRRPSVEASRRCADKRLLRRCLQDAGLPQPQWELVAVGDDPCPAAHRMGYPVVIKPLGLSASRGVMRVNNDEQMRAGAQRLCRLLAQPEVGARAVEDDAADWILVEQFMPGAEIAFEGLVSGGQVRELAIFDKPDPLDGPFFAETLYITPSRLSASTQAQVRKQVSLAAQALGVEEGPIHAELRISDSPTVLELATRSIGGLCGRVLRFGAGISLEELVMAHCLGRPAGSTREGRAGGVLMLPVSDPGVLAAVRGIAAAEQVQGIREVVITARPGDRMVPLPEGRSYAGFVFAEGAGPDEVETALRIAGALIGFEVRTVLDS